MEVTHAKNTISNFKRLIGRRFHDSHVQQEKQLNSYSIIEGNNGSVNIEVKRNVFFCCVFSFNNLRRFRSIILANVNDLHPNK